MALHPFNWPKTDGDPDRWPAVGRNGAPDASWYKSVAASDKKSELYETKVGQHVASRLALPGTGHRIHLPEGYALFSHCKPQGEGKVREDVYLFGSKHVLKFRSPNELLPHVEWLLSSTSVDDHSTCGCMYNKGSAANIKRKEGGAKDSSTPTSAKRPKAEGQLVGQNKPKKRRASRSEDDSSDEEGVDSVPLERGIDLQSQRRFRRGELVWSRIQTVVPPPEAAARGCPLITHWPALVSKITQKTKVVQVEQKGPTWAATTSLPTTTPPTNGGPSPSTSTLTSAPAPVAAGPNANVKQKVIHYYDYHLRPLGFFSSVDEVLTDSKDMLPWLIGSELMGGEPGWAALGQESVMLMEQAARKEADAEKAKPEGERQALTAEKRWKQTKYASRVLFVDMPMEWEFLCPRAALAIKMGLVITSSWTQTDMINVVDPTELSEEDRIAIQQQKKTIYQGLWWGGERIWLEDMVRVNKRRSQLPADVCPTDEHTPKDGCVFLKLRLISLQVQETDSATQEAVAWRCMTYGDLYELVPEATAQGTPQPMAQVVMKRNEPLVAVHRAPKGYKYRQINSPDTEITVDVSDFAGRVYPDLGDGTTQSYFADPKATAEQNAGKLKPGMWMRGLMGLESGTEVFGYSDQWRADLYAIIKYANKSVETETMSFYGAELEKNGLVLAPSAGGEDVDLLNNRGPVPFGMSTTATVPAASAARVSGTGNGNGNGNGDVEMREVGSAPATLMEAGV